MPKILNYDTFCEELDEVTSLKTFGKRKFHPDGLFSEQIFGPIRNYTCQCGKYHGVSKVGGQCSECKVDIVNSDERRKRFAKITIPIDVVNPLFYDLLVDLAHSSFSSVQYIYMAVIGSDFLALVNSDVCDRCFPWTRSWPNWV